MIFLSIDSYLILICSDSFKHDEMTQMGIDNINALLDSFMGINDSELAEQVPKLVQKILDMCENSDQTRQNKTFFAIV